MQFRRELLWVFGLRIVIMMLQVYRVWQKINRHWMHSGKREYESKMHTATAFMLYATAYKILHDLKPHTSDDLSCNEAEVCGHSGSVLYDASQRNFLPVVLLR